MVNERNNNNTVAVEDETAVGIPVVMPPSDNEAQVDEEQPRVSVIHQEPVVQGHKMVAMSPEQYE